MPKAEKERQVQELEERFRKAKAFVVTSFMGINASEMVELRRELKRHHLEYRVVKNRLAQLAASRAGLKIDPLLEGPTGICFSYEDPALAFRLSLALARKYEQYKIRGGMMDGALVDARGVEELAQLPSREELLSRLTSALSTPIQSLAGALHGLLHQLVVGLSEVAKLKAQGNSVKGSEKGASER